MSLQHWLGERRLRPHQPTAEEIDDLWEIVDRDLKDAIVEQLSLDRRYASAYNAILQLATIVLRASGYRTAGEAHHWLTFQALPLLIRSLDQDKIHFFDSCRRKRNRVDYDAAGETSSAEAREIYEEATIFRGEVLAWLGKEHPELNPRV